MIFGAKDNFFAGHASHLSEKIFEQSCVDCRNNISWIKVKFYLVHSEEWQFRAIPPNLYVARNSWDDARSNISRRSLGASARSPSILNSSKIGIGCQQRPDSVPYREGSIKDADVSQSAVRLKISRDI